MQPMSAMRLKPHETIVFSSESVGEGHPDKVCDQIADAILDACLCVDSLAKVAVEVAVDSGLVVVFGTVTCNGTISVEKAVRHVLKIIGYTEPTQEINCYTCQVIDRVQFYYTGSEVNGDASPSSSEMSEFSPAQIGAGDLGIIFGYATDETPSLLPLTIDLAHKITRNLKAARLDGTLPWLWPDAKAQVAVEYTLDEGALVPCRVISIVLITQHDSSITLDYLRTELIEKVIKQTVPAEFLDPETEYHIQPCGNVGIVPSGKFAGVTGRKIAVDSYGGWGSTGGGAFSGKDFRQVDRSAAYAARWIAKSLVAAKLARRCLLQVSYAIGISEPLSIYIDAYGTSQNSRAELAQIVRDNFDLRPAAMARDLHLTQPIFNSTARNGHFTDQSYSWEVAKKLNF